MISRYFCPVTACDWTLDVPDPTPPDLAGKSFSYATLAPAVPDMSSAVEQLVTAALTNHAREVDATLQEHFDSHPSSDWARELSVALAAGRRKDALIGQYRHLLREQVRLVPPELMPPRPAARPAGRPPGPPARVAAPAATA